MLTKRETEIERVRERKGQSARATATVLSAAGSFDSPVILSLATTLSAAAAAAAVAARAASRIVDCGSNRCPVLGRQLDFCLAADCFRQNVVILLRTCQLCVCFTERSVREEAWLKSIS